MRKDCYGLVLAGGLGRRVGYQNKGLLNAGGQPLFLYACARLAPQVKKIFVSANQDIQMYETAGYCVLRDHDKYQGLGPLAGIERVSQLLPCNSRLQVVTCDAPFISDQLVERLYTASQLSGVSAVYPVTAQYAHYTFLQVDCEDLMRVSALLDQKRLRVRDFLDLLGAQSVFFNNEEEFFNVNTREMLDSINAHLTKQKENDDAGL